MLFCSLKDVGIRVLLTSFYRKKLISLTLVGTSGMDVRAVLSSFTEDKVTSTVFTVFFIRSIYYLTWE
jgi:hypothetical protein